MSEISFFISLRNIVYSALLAWIAPACLFSRSASAQTPLDLRCAYIDIGAGLYGEPSMHCFDLEMRCPAGHSFGCFKRDLMFEDGFVRESGQPDRRITAQPFGFIDAGGKHWDVPVGYPTDGASIPDAFKPFIGGSWTEQYVRAAVVHDFYIRRNTSNAAAVHRVFHDALLASGVAPDRAYLMYRAVNNFGPDWKSIDLPAYEQRRQENLEEIRRQNEVYEREYRACLEQHIQAMQSPTTEQAWAACPLDGKHQFVLDFFSVAADAITKSGATILDDLQAGRCIEEAPGKYFCPSP